MAELLKKGHLKDLLKEWGRATRDRNPNGVEDNALPIPPKKNMIVNVISEDLDVSRVSYAAAKRSTELQDQTFIKLDTMILTSCG